MGNGRTDGRMGKQRGPLPPYRVTLSVQASKAVNGAIQVVIHVAHPPRWRLGQRQGRRTGLLARGEERRGPREARRIVRGMLAFLCGLLE
jgi:hypothetical protein